MALLDVGYADMQAFMEDKKAVYGKAARDAGVVK
jgi:hypothetical protein